MFIKVFTLRVLLYNLTYLVVSDAYRVGITRAENTSVSLC